VGSADTRTGAGSGRSKPQRGERLLGVSDSVVEPAVRGGASPVADAVWSRGPQSGPASETPSKFQTTRAPREPFTSTQHAAGISDHSATRLRATRVRHSSGTGRVVSGSCHRPLVPVGPPTLTNCRTSDAAQPSGSTPSRCSQPGVGPAWLTDVDSRSRGALSHP
jgi:hypothetical protein